ISAARLVLVMGASVSEAALETGLTRQVVHRFMARIRARLEDLPVDWVKVEAWLPPAAAGDVNHSDLLDRNRRGVPWLFQPRCSLTADNL
ncbi:TrfB-related DNA-binding protein, partial [Pseudomonas savastanoi]